MNAAPQLRDRIRELRRVTAGELLANPKNWRTHPDPQRAGLRTVLERIGIVGALMAYESPEQGGQLTLIDGHLRRDEYPETEWPVLVLDVETEEEAAEILAVFDPIGAMAEADQLALAELLEGIETDDEGLAGLLTQIGEEAGAVAVELEPPPEFPEVGENLPTEHTCPECGYQWSGSA
ncbi:MAG: hypothetical protein GY719_25790 [bacterium]|nr:hypothetical protein [bacterium]